MSEPPSSAERLILRAIAGEASAIGPLLAAHEADLRSYLRVRAHDLLGSRESVSDVLQESLLQAVQSIGEFEYRTEAEFRGWLRTIAERKLVERVRFHHRAKRDMGRERVLDEGIAAGSSLADSAFRALVGGEARRTGDLENMQRALARLSAAEREVLFLAYVCGMNARQIAEKLGLAEDAARKRRLRARARLAGFYGEADRGGADR